jgi:hypothetical protein
MRTTTQTDETVEPTAAPRSEVKVEVATPCKMFTLVLN